MTEPKGHHISGPDDEAVPYGVIFSAQFGENVGLNNFFPLMGNYREGSLFGEFDRAEPDERAAEREGLTAMEMLTSPTGGPPQDEPHLEGNQLWPGYQEDPPQTETEEHR